MTGPAWPGIVLDKYRHYLSVMKKETKGKIDISQLSNPPEKNEFATAKYFADRGKDIVFIRPSNIKENYRPDFIMDGKEWEVKNPEGKGKHTIDRNICHAAKQSDHIIFDLRHYKGNEDSYISKLKMEFQMRVNIKQLLIIKKGGELFSLGNEIS